MAVSQHSNVENVSRGNIVTKPRFVRSKSNEDLLKQVSDFIDNVTVAW